MYDIDEEGTMRNRSTVAAITLQSSALIFWLMIGSTLAASASGRGEGADLEIGGPGSGPGQFIGLQDFTFDEQNRLYVLEGQPLNPSKWQGNYRVQVFDDAGRYLRQFSVRDEALGKKTIRRGLPLIVPVMCMSRSQTEALSNNFHQRGRR
jgi:hypothetical protein